MEAEKKKAESGKKKEGSQHIPVFVSERTQEGRIPRMTAVFVQRRAIHHVRKKNAQKANFWHLGRYAISMIF